MSETPRKRRIPIGGMLLGALVAFVFSPIAFQLALWFQAADLPADRHDLAISVMRIGFRFAQVWVVLLVLAPIFLLGLLPFRRVRRFALIPLVMIPISIGTFFAARTMTNLRDEGLSRITFNAQPILAAIEQYKADTGVFPPNLGALIPEYIKELPYTGTPGYPKFEYDLAAEGTPFRDYQLSVKTPPGANYHDRLIYWPEMNYPLWIKGASVEPLNDWAYMHRH